MGRLAALAVVFCIAPGFLFAAEESVPLKIAILDIDRVLRNAVAVQDIQGKLRTHREAYRIEIQKEEEEIRAAHIQLGESKDGLTDEAYENQQKRLNERVSAAQAMTQKRRRMLDEARAKAMTIVQTTLNTIVAEIANERNLTLILRKDQTVLAATQLEITEEVLMRLDTKLPVVEVLSPEGE
ncbi:MAG: OmpH family outer membrane protein [Rhodospirillales bacterium]|nr:OmpH family outer membrane protein [Rhodospirillales bacterium]